ncbi:MAG: nitrous oxide reductase accessory protein NosL [Verrucomicrobia bacterium]|nr:nitrous oxide reductase accessory protein NosL [Verrucomicrobiota bacterium]
MKRSRKFSPATLALAALVALAGCGDTQPKAINYGRDECAECKMTLVNQRYGAELISAKGKVFKFDDLNCLLAFEKKNAAGPAPQAYVVDCNRPNQFLSSDQAILLQHDGLRTPMGSRFAAFASETELETARTQLGGAGKTLRWPDLLRPPSAEKTAACTTCCSAEKKP